MSYWDPSLVRIARLETKVRGERFGENQIFFLFIAMRNSSTCIDADETMPRLSRLTQASDAQDQLRELLFSWTDIACARHFFQALAGAEAGLNPNTTVRRANPEGTKRDEVSGMAMRIEGLLQLGLAVPWSAPTKQRIAQSQVEPSGRLLYS